MRVTWLAGMAGVAVCALWAFGPLQAPAAPGVTLLRPMSDPVGIEAIVKSIDQTAFAARLWNAPPTPDRGGPVADDRSKRQPPLRLELIGITRDNDRLYAVLYDPESDRLLTVGDGDQIRDHTVTAISESEVELSDGRSTRRLALREGRS